jgi:O-antigen/teichoic acid export membrane protein
VPSGGESGERHVSTPTVRSTLDFDGVFVTSALSRILVGQALGGVALRVAGTGAGFLASILLARALGPTGFGLYAVVVASATLLATAGALGWPGLVTREAATALAMHDWQRLRGIARYSLLTTGLSSTAAAIGIFLLIHTGIVGYTPIEDVSDPTVLLGVLLVPVLAISLVRSAILRGVRQVMRADFPDLVVRPFVMLILLLSLSIGGAGRQVMDIETALVLQFSATLAAFILGFAFLKRMLPRRGTTVRPAGWLRSAAPFWLIAQVGLLLGQAPLYLLGTSAPAKELGLFAIAAQFAGIISLCMISIEMPLQGRLAEAKARNDTVEAERLAREAGRLGLGVAVLGGGVLILFAEQFLHFAGPDYLAAATALRVLVLGHIVYALAGPCRIVLSMSGEERIVLRAVVIALGATIVVALAVVPSFGASGAAAAGAGGTAILNLLLQFASWHRLRISTSPLLPPRQ